MHRRSLLALVVPTALSLAAPFAAAQSYPSKPIRLVVPFPAGGATDLLARALAQRLGQGLGQTVVVDNKSGGGGALGLAEAAKAASDGYTLLVATSGTHAIGPHLKPKLPYKTTGAKSDFTPIAHVADISNVLLVPLQLPVANVKELIAYAKARPGQLNYASSGNGSVVHLTSEAFKAQAGIYVTRIAYRGTALAVPDLMSGDMHMLFDGISSGLSLAKDGKLKALAVTGRVRSGLAPELPTVAESGLPGFVCTTWFGIYGPRGLPNPITARLNAEVNKAMQSAEVRERLARLGADVAAANTPAQFAAMVQADSERWAAIIRERKISLD